VVHAVFEDERSIVSVGTPGGRSRQARQAAAVRSHPSHAAKLSGPCRRSAGVAVGQLRRRDNEPWAGDGERLGCDRSCDTCAAKLKGRRRTAAQLTRKRSWAVPCVNMRRYDESDA